MIIALYSVLFLFLTGLGIILTKSIPITWIKVTTSISSTVITWGILIIFYQPYPALITYVVIVVSITFVINMVLAIYYQTTNHIHYIGALISELLPMGILLVIGIIAPTMLTVGVSYWLQLLIIIVVLGVLFTIKYYWNSLSISLSSLMIILSVLFIVQNLFQMIQTFSIQQQVMLVNGQIVDVVQDETESIVPPSTLFVQTMVQSDSFYASKGSEFVVTETGYLMTYYDCIIDFYPQEGVAQEVFSESGYCYTVNTDEGVFMEHTEKESDVWVSTIYHFEEDQFIPTEMSIPTPSETLPSYASESTLIGDVIHDQKRHIYAIKDDYRLLGTGPDYYASYDDQDHIVYVYSVSEKTLNSFVFAHLRNYLFLTALIFVLPADLKGLKRRINSVSNIS